MQEDAILIKATSTRNGITCLVIGIVGILLVSLLLAIVPQVFFLPGIFLLSAALVCALIGWFKLREPAFSFRLTPAAIGFSHRKGSWLLPWSNIQRVDCPRQTLGIEQRELDFVGIKIKDYAAFLQTLSPRLAMHLLVEQRPLLLHALRSQCSTGQCYESHFLNDDRFQLPSGETLKGIPAMFAHRMAQFREHYGFDLLIAAADLDRDPPAFADLLRRCQGASVEVSLASA